MRVRAFCSEVPARCKGVVFALLALTFTAGGAEVISPVARVVGAWNALVGKAGVPAAFRDLLYGASGGPRLSQPYSQSPWVQRAIKKIADPIAAVPLQFTSDARGGEAQISNAALSAFWEKPALGPSGPINRADFIEASVGWLKLEGETFWILDDTWFTNRFSAARSPFIIARPDRMRHIVQDGQVIGWEFTDGSRHRHMLPASNVIHLKFWNPYDDFRGLAEYEAARIAAEADMLAGQFQLNLMRNNGSRGEYVIAKNGMPTDEQREQIIAALREKHALNQKGINRPMFFTGDISIEDPKIMSPDAQFVAQRLENRHEIYIALGVPPSMADIVASYSVGAASDRYILIEDTCMPLANGKLADGIEAVSSLILPGRQIVHASFNFDEHSVMQQVREARISTAKDLWDRGVSWKDASELLGLKMKAFPGWDVAYIPFSVTEVGEPRINVTERVDTTTPEDAPQEPDAAEKAFVGITKLLESADPLSRLERALQLGARATGGASPLWQQHSAKRKAAIKGYASKFTKQLVFARAETLRNIEKHKAVKGKAAAADLVFDLSAFTGHLQVAMRKQASGTLQKAGQELFGEVRKDDVFAMPSGAAMRFLAERDNLMVDVADEVWNDVRDALQEGIAAGETMDELATRVRSQFNDLADGRAETVASTETAAAYGVARQQAMEQAGVQAKQWLTSGLPNVRTAHADANDQIVLANEPFQVGGEALDHPGDPKGSPENVINCHCVAIAVAKPSDKE